MTKRHVRANCDDVSAAGAATHPLPAEYLKITVVTPSYNQGEFIERTICSVLGQAYPNLEYIVVDGGSTDGSLEIIKRYSNKLAYWTSEKDAGQADALRKGFSKSTGSILCWLNSDDVLLPGALAQVNKYFQSHPYHEVVSGGAIQITEADTLFECWCNYTMGVRASYKRLCVVGQQGVYQPSTFWRRDAYVSVGGINPQLQFIMDLDLFARLAKRRRFGRLRSLLAAFRIHSAAKSAQIQDVHAEELTDFRSRYPYKSRVPFGTPIVRWFYWFVVQAEKVLLVASKPWILRKGASTLQDLENLDPGYRRPHNES